jgi:hypothetical protein
MPSSLKAYELFFKDLLRKKNDEEPPFSQSWENPRRNFSKVVKNQNDWSQNYIKHFDFWL